MKTNLNLSTSFPSGAAESTVPVIGICGFSGSGKTTLIAKLVHRLQSEGLQVLVIKQDAHGLNIDREGKDTDVLFRAGAAVHIRDQQQCFYRAHTTPSLQEIIHALAPQYDLILVEGHKSATLPHKFWLCKAGGTTPPPEARDIKQALPWNADREAILLPYIHDCLQQACLAAPVYAGILIGGKSTRMGTSKHLLQTGTTTWVEHMLTTMAPFVQQSLILGAGELPAAIAHIPRLPDVPGIRGPLAGMRAAMRWGANTNWVFCACDMPHISTEGAAWLLAQRRPGIRAILPKRPDASRPEPLLAWYSHHMAPALEQVSRPRDIAHYPGAITPEIPTHLENQWCNANTPQDIA